ncbi:hypothetical protein KIW84_033197 [Lathyrus oleraceus]|uniref:Reverse transcriptase zinc-binding domain-containing protein n=1 Tax=Pisum sativum TaxID=3888 RepID=A0A9D4Y015_PEA|nr:hypothetical protein KIW84_033197 [Pisum sativum]
MIDGTLLGGDFNEVLQASEKRGGLPASARKCALFQNRMDSCRLMDLYAIGHISSHGETYEAMLTEAWSQNNDLRENLDRVKNMTNSWNMHTVRSLQQEKNELLGRISSIQKATQEGKAGYFVLKVDLTKACDKLNWSFLEKVLIEVGLYLGVPITGRSPKAKDYQHVIDKEIERCHQNFIWGDWDDKRHIHTVNCNWNTITKPKVKGGLGLRKLTDMNRASLAKLCWNLKKGGKEIWCKVENNVALRNYRQLLPPFLLEKTWEDVRMWGGSANGNFSTATMYDNLTNTGGQDIKWKKIWRIKVPERIRMFIWIMHWNALKTNQFVAQRHLRDPDCTECRGKDESQIHVLHVMMKGAGKSTMGHCMSRWYTQTIRSQTPPFLDVVGGGRSHLASVSNRLPHCCCLIHPSYCLHRRNPHPLPLSPATAALVVKNDEELCVLWSGCATPPP